MNLMKTTLNKYKELHYQAKQKISDIYITTNHLEDRSQLFEDFAAQLNADTLAKLIIFDTTSTDPGLKTLCDSIRRITFCTVVDVTIYTIAPGYRCSDDMKVSYTKGLKFMSPSEFQVIIQHDGSLTQPSHQSNLGI